MDTITYIVCGVTGTLLLGTISALFSYKNKMDERYNYMHNRVECLYDKVEKILIDRHEELLQLQRTQGQYAEAVPLCISSEPSVPLLDPINYSTHPLMNYEKDVYVSMYT